MASGELIIDDDYCRAMGRYFVQQGAQLDKSIAEYISILRDVKDKGIVSGQVSDALSSYIEYAQQLKGQMETISTSLNVQIDNFLKRIDSEDQYLF